MTENKLYMYLPNEDYRATVKVQEDGDGETLLAIEHIIEYCTM